MRPNDKVQTFAVELRRSSRTAKLSTIRSRLLYHSLSPSTSLQYSHYKYLLSSHNDLSSPTTISTLKLYSHLHYVAIDLHDNHFLKLYTLLINIDYQHLSPTSYNTYYTDLTTILINILSHCYVTPNTLPPSSLSFINIVKKLLNPYLYIITMWFIANLICTQYNNSDRKNPISNFIIQYLLRYDAIGYLYQRIGGKFNTYDDIVIFTYFSCTFLKYCSMFEIGEYRAVLKVISRLQALNSYEIDWQILDALVDHAAEFAFHCYEVFDMGLLTRCEEYCRAKRSKFVGKFIDIVNELVRSYGHKLQLSNYSYRKKLQREQYDRLKHNNILKNAEFCLENRSPDIKRNLCELCSMLITYYYEVIDLYGEYLYLTLASYLYKISKMPDPTLVSFLRYLHSLTMAILYHLNVRNVDSLDSLTNFLDYTLFFDRIGYAFEHCAYARKIALTIVLGLVRLDTEIVSKKIMNSRLMIVLEYGLTKGEYYYSVYAILIELKDRTKTK